MVQFKLEGDLTLSDKHIKVISKVLRERGFENEEVIIEPVGKAGDNFGSTVKRFTVKKGEQTFKIVAKIAATSPELRSTLCAESIFRNEYNMYKIILPKFQEIENQANVPENYRLRFASCYDALIEEFHEMVLMEDLKESGHVMLQKYDSFTDETVKLVLASFARLHSLSHALKKKDPAFFNEIKNKLLGWDLLVESVEWTAIIKQLAEQVGDLLKTHKYGPKAQKAVSELISNITNNLKIDRNSDFSIIQQGDAWTNNIMFQIKDGKPSTCCFVDYQVSNYNSAACDLTYMIYICTDHETRSKHYYEWIDFYHSELDKCLKFHNFTASEIYSKDQLDADIKRHAKVAVGMAIMVNSMTMKDSNEAEQLKNAMGKKTTNNEVLNLTQVMGSSTTERFTNRVVSIMKSAEEFGIL